MIEIKQSVTLRSP